MSLCAAILAGGRAARFGNRPKGLATVDGKSVLERQLDVLSRRVEDIALIGDDLTPYEAIGTDTVTRLGDATPGAGPMAGLASALAWAPTEWVFVVAADLPLIDERIIDALLAGVTPGVFMVAPVLDSRVQPLASLYNRAALSTVRGCLDAGLLSPSRLFSDGENRNENARRIEVTPEVAATLRGFNSEDELALLRRDATSLA